MRCLAPNEMLEWTEEIEAARSPLNPHRVPEFDSDEETKAA